MSKTNIEFINHASVRISYEDASLLSDPWYFGDAFHKGWSLLTEQSNDEIIRIIRSITHIWISHEHPDHFSIPFLKNIEKKNRKEIEILYQETYDKRLKKFCESQGYKFRELKNNLLI